MAEMKHSPEPWRFCSASNGRCSCRTIMDEHEAIAYVLNAGDSDEFGETPIDDKTVFANLHRIVACVNACKGIPTEVLAAGLVRMECDMAGVARLKAAKPRRRRA